MHVSFMIGILKGVPALTVDFEGISTLSVDWERPYSLNLSNVEPDITYCLDVKIFNDSSRLGFIFSTCGIIVTEYVFHNIVDSRPCDVYEVFVTPVNGAGNGSVVSVISDVYLQQGNYMHACLINVSLVHVKHSLEY